VHEKEVVWGIRSALLDFNFLRRYAFCFGIYI
jgi:hypothetical protein